jgi:hypothetical protein
MLPAGEFAAMPAPRLVLVPVASDPAAADPDEVAAVPVLTWPKLKPVPNATVEPASAGADVSAEMATESNNLRIGFILCFGCPEC